jgi:flavin reductase (DIM6/NTAB) family NADH-FMN oxidoreductase RutF
MTVRATAPVAEMRFIDKRVFRSAMQKTASEVTVITTSGSADKARLTLLSFCSLSMTSLPRVRHGQCEQGGLRA